MQNENELTSRELESLLGVSRDTLKHWRYGYYTNSRGEKVYYRDDHMGVPCILKETTQYQYYTYSLSDVEKWIGSWKTESSKRNHILSVLDKVKGKKC